MQQTPDLPPEVREIPLLEGARVHRRLAGGLASNSWLVEDRGDAMVVRVDTPLARKLNLDRVAELGVLETVSAAGIGPDVVWADPIAGLLVTRYIPETVWREKDVQDAPRLRNLTATLQRLHGLPAAGPVFDPAQAARTYALGIGTRAALELADEAVALASQLLEPEHRRALCHNDLVHMNIVGSNPVRLIDWEYAAVGDPLFDLAVVVRHHRLPATVAAEFLRSYHAGGIDAPLTERFHAFCHLYEMLAKLWYAAVDEQE